MPKMPERLAGLSGLMLLLAADTMALPHPVQVESVTYCEEISDKLGQYSSQEELFDDLTVKARRKALKQLLVNELGNFEPQLMSQDVFIDTLLHLVSYEDAHQASDGVLTPCVTLGGVRIESLYRERFKPVEAGKVCSFSDELLQNQTREMKEEFVDKFFTKKARKKDDNPSEISELVAHPEKINKKFGKDLLKLLREQPAPATAGALEETRCTSLQVYPIELYALSVPYRQTAKNEQTADLSTDDLKTLADQQARWHGIDPRLFRALIEQESRWETQAVSHKGAVGLAQLMPATGREECGLNRQELADPQKNLGCAAHYLAKYISRFNDVKLALCAYNAGPAAVTAGNCGRYRETRSYVRKIIDSANT